MKGITVLLVDDDIDFIAANKAALEAASFTVLTAYNGTEGMQTALNHHVDVAVLDVMMETPEEGFELARQMRKDDKTKTIPLLMLTSVNEVNREAGYTFKFSDRDRDDMWLPVDKFLDKPVKPHDLVNAVQGLVKECPNCQE
jgi:CheY-like chemotaxis protein